MLPDALTRASTTGRMALACDVSPPRSLAALDFEVLRALHADLLCCSYLPGRAVRLDAAVLAALLQRDLAVETIYALATRDMNRLALSVHLLSAAALGVRNVVILHGDGFTIRDRSRVRAVRDTTPTQMIAIASELAAGRDFRGRDLGGVVPICVGAAFNPDRDLAQEIALTVRKLDAGARFLLTEPIYDVTYPERLAAAYRAYAGRQLDVPVLWGVAILTSSSVAISAVPERWQRALAAGRPGTEIALEFLLELRDRGIVGAYLIPPIFAGGERDYAAAAHVLAALRRIDG